MEYLKLIGIVIIVVGFACKLDSILVIMVAAVATALVAGLDPLTFFQTLGQSFVDNRSMLIFIIVMVVTGTLERNGLKQAAAALMQRLRGASAGMLFIAGPWLPAELVGVLVVVMVIPPILKRVSPGSDRDPSDAEMEAGYRSIGMKIFVPALCIGVFALAFALFTPISSLVGIGVGVLAAALILMAYSRKNKPRVRVRSW